MSELKSYVRFASTNPKLDFTFLHPGNWQVREVKGAGYDEVSILGPRNRQETYNLALAVRVTPTRKQGGRHAGYAEFVSDFLAKCERLSGFQEILRARGHLAGVEATEIEISYMIPLPINTLNPQETRIVERRILLEKGEHFYEVMYRAVEEDYYRYLEAFKNVVRTFEFRDDTAQQVYRPLVTPMPAHTAYESSAEYETNTDES